MPQSPRTVTVVTLLVVTATLLPVVGVATTEHGDTTELDGPTATTPGNDTTIRLHRVPNGTSPTNLPNHVGLDEPSDPVFFRGDGLVVTVQSAALAANVSNASGASLTERFAATQRNGSRLWVIQTNPTPDQEPKVIDLSDAANLTVVAGDRPATYHVVVDTRTVETVYGDPSDAELLYTDLRPEEEFYAGFDGFPDGEPPANRTIEVGTADIDVPGGYREQVYRFEPTRNATVSGSATLPPSTPVTVELVNTTTGRVVASDRATVERIDGGDTTEFRFTASLNLTGEYGDRYELHARSNQTNLGDPVTAVVRPREASLSFRNDTAQGGTTVENVTLTWGGFVVLHEAGEPSTLIGISSYVYPRPEPQSVDVQLSIGLEERTTLVAVAYRDVNRNGELDEPDEPYQANGEPVSATAVVEPPTEPVTTTPTMSPTPTVTPTQVVDTGEPTDTATTATLGMSDPDDTDDDGSVPGFEIVGTLAALLALCALVVRRR